MKRAPFLIACLLISGVAHAQSQPSLTDLVDDSVGYTPVGENVVLIETEEMGTWFCELRFGANAFSNYAAGQLADGDVDYTCIPAESFDK